MLVQDVFKKSTGNFDAIFGIALWDLKTGQKYFFNGSEQFEQASLYKLALMYTIFYLESKGKLDAEKPDIKNNLEKMITISSNDAALYLLNKYTSWQEVNKLMKQKNLSNTDFSTSLTTTPEDMAKLLSLINDPGDINPQVRDKMMELLKNQTINDRIPALLPKEVAVYHKTADLDNVVHDAGIVEDGNTSYILVIMTKNSKDHESVKKIIAKISLDIYHLMK